jgi:murein DD-endopeptidase MepM/ murein hydrolase activator NlpD
MLLSGGCVLALAACDPFATDMRAGFNTSPSVEGFEAAPRPQPDTRGIIAYPTYQVAVARGGDTPGSIASRIGLPAEELARFNGMPADAVLNAGAILALPRRVAEPVAGTGTGSGNVDIATLAGSAIDRAAPRQTQGTGTGAITPAAGSPTQTISSQPLATSSPAPAVGPEPIRHKVARGETAYSVARLYGVNVRDLAEWNGLDSSMNLREGQFLLIPVSATSATSARTASLATTAPGAGSPTPTPPSAAQALPAETPQPAAQKPSNTPASPDLGKLASASSSARFTAPVNGSIIRDFQKGKREGIDIAVAAGTPVKAAEAGTIAAITQDTDQVPIIVMRHDGGLLTVYANVDGVKVSKGDSVSRGQAIAVVGQNNPSFLHFEVRRGMEAVDPSTYIN